MESLVEVPARPELPTVEFQQPGKSGAVLCLDEANLEALVQGETALKTHVLRLERIVEQCR